MSSDAAAGREQHHIARGRGAGVARGADHLGHHVIVACRRPSRRGHRARVGQVRRRSRPGRRRAARRRQPRPTARTRSSTSAPLSWPPAIQTTARVGRAARRARRAGWSPWSRRRTHPGDRRPTSALRCGSGHEARSPSGDRGRRHAVRAGQRGRGQRVGHVVRPGRPDVGDRGAAAPASPKAWSTSMPSTTPSSPAPGARRGERRPGAAAGAAASSAAAPGSSTSRDRDRRRAAPAPSPRRTRPCAVPVEVVLGDVQHARRRRAAARRPVQLEAGQLDGEHVVRPGRDRVQHRPADVAAGDGVARRPPAGSLRAC